MKKQRVSLQPSEKAVFQVAGQIYAAYITSRKVEQGKESEWMERSLKEASELAEMTDQTLQSDTELD